MDYKIGHGYYHNSNHNHVVCKKSLTSKWPRQAWARCDVEGPGKLQKPCCTLIIPDPGQLWFHKPGFDATKLIICFMHNCFMHITNISILIMVYSPAASGTKYNPVGILVWKQTTMLVASRGPWCFIKSLVALWEMVRSYIFDTFNDFGRIAIFRHLKSTTNPDYSFSYAPIWSYLVSNWPQGNTTCK